MTETRRALPPARPTTRSALIVLFAALGASCSPPAESQPETVERLIAGTEGVDSFVALYQVTSSDGAQSILRLVYQAPDKAKMEITAAVSETVPALSSSMIVGGELSMAASMGPDQNGSAKVDLKPLVERGREVDRLLDELFPAPDAAPPSAEGVTFSLDWGEKNAAGKPYVTFGVAYVGRRKALLGWLPRLREIPCREGATDTLDYELVDTFTIELSKQTGFIERVTGEYEDRKSTFVLHDLQVHAEIDPSEFQPHEVSPQAVDLTSQIVKPIAETALAAQRELAFERVDSGVAGGRTVWDEGARANLGRVLQLAHAQASPHVFRDWTEDSRGRVGQLQKHLQEELQKDGADRSKIEQESAKLRTELVSTLEHLRGAYGQQLEVPMRDAGGDDGEGRDVARAQEYLEIDRQAAALAFEEQVAKPILAYFDEQIRTVWGG